MKISNKKICFILHKFSPFLSAGKISENSNFFGGLFLCTLTLHFLFGIQGWQNLILDIHDYRQTQTALSSLWTVRDGFRLDYLTPLFGPPWEIPFEFPLYQWIVASLHSNTGYPLDQSGRFISIFFST